MTRTPIIDILRERAERADAVIAEQNAQIKDLRARLEGAAEAAPAGRDAFASTIEDRLALYGLEPYETASLESAVAVIEHLEKELEKSAEEIQKQAQGIITISQYRKEAEQAAEQKTKLTNDEFNLLRTRLLAAINEANRVGLELEQAQRNEKRADRHIDNLEALTTKQDGEITRLRNELNQANAQMQQIWIPIAHSWPAEGDKVLISVAGTIYAGYWLTQDAGDKLEQEHPIQVWYFADFQSENFTDLDGLPDAWQPMPAPYVAPRPEPKSARDAYTLGYNDGHQTDETRNENNPYPEGSQEHIAYNNGYNQGCQDW